MGLPDDCFFSAAAWNSVMRAWERRRRYVQRLCSAWCTIVKVTRSLVPPIRRRWPAARPPRCTTVSPRSAGRIITLATSVGARPPEWYNTWNRSPSTLSVANSNSNNSRSDGFCCSPGPGPSRRARWPPTTPRCRRYRPTCPGGKSPPVAGPKVARISHPLRRRPTIRRYISNGPLSYVRDRFRARPQVGFRFVFGFFFVPIARAPEARAF